MKKTMFALIAGLAFLFLLQKTASAKTSGIILKDIGVIGLMSHDLFSWDHKQNINTENGRLDLSTIFEYEGGRHWEQGGNPKNCENSPVCTITMKLVDFYKNEMKTKSPEVARQSTVIRFQEMVKESYQRLSDLPVPTIAIDEPVNNVEQAALRAMHDILPGRVKLFHRTIKEMKLTDFLFAKLQLNEDELNQPLRPFDGDYDPEYKAIKIPFSDKMINLMEIDGKFIETYSPYRQSEMLVELAKAGRGEIRMREVFFIHHVSEMFAKGLCAKNNPWMPRDLNCL